MTWLWLGLAVAIVFISVYDRKFRTYIKVAAVIMFVLITLPFLLLILLIAAPLLARGLNSRVFTTIALLPIIKHLKFFQIPKSRGRRNNAYEPKEKTLNPMTKKEAREILGVDQSSNKAEIKSAYKKMMGKNHPDKGGSAFLAARINEAKDKLLG